ncbi:hypothetical protein ACEYYB_08360 [Paracoccus sp. p4-l81]|uniref:hypothetical protein n=1 Tax=Paracoccus sp. p4-l81 TaxID=3342806 RepID=UPI0035B88FDF
MTRKTHPDSHELDDWPLYGPRNTDIARLVVQLAEQHQMGLADIEAIMLAALSRQLAASGVAPADVPAATDYQLGHDLMAQKELLVQAYEAGDVGGIDQALTRVVAVRRMKANGTLEWQDPEAET